MNPPYSWQPLGALLVAKGLLTENQLQWALSEQQRTGRLVGEILVESGTLSAFTLTRALTEQHGVEIQSATKPEPEPAPPPAVWRPLGKLLVEEGFLTREQLHQALARQQESHGRRKLGEILVAEGFLYGHRPRAGAGEAERRRARQERGRRDRRCDRSSTSSSSTRCSRSPTSRTTRPHEVLYESASFLEAVDFAAEHIEDADPTGSRSSARTAGPGRRSGRTATPAPPPPPCRDEASPRRSASTPRCGAALPA